MELKKVILIYIVILILLKHRFVALMLLELQINCLTQISFKYKIALIRMLILDSNTY